LEWVGSPSSASRLTSGADHHHPGGRDSKTGLAAFGQVTGPVLRLVTCTGTFDRASGHYLDNLVVTARPAG